jgi:hypothetical protein
MVDSSSVARQLAPVGARPLGGGTVVYDSVATIGNNKLSSYISSLGFECCATKEFGDGLILTQAGARLKGVEVVFSSWGCQSGTWYGGNCVSAKGAKFAWPVTVNVYAVNPSGPSVGALLTSRTFTVNFPYRPSANNKVCQGPNAGAFLGPYDKMCDNGLSAGINFNMALPKTILPQEIVVSVAYNTSDAGYNPVGQGTSCFGTSGGCPYDALNVSADGNGGFVGGNLDPNGVFVNFGYPGNYCSGNGSGFILDTPCWTGYHPEIKLTTF